MYILVYLYILVADLLIFIVSELTDSFYASVESLHHGLHHFNIMSFEFLEGFLMIDTRTLTWCLLK